jgi:hypothetical protein
MSTRLFQCSRRLTPPFSFFLTVILGGCLFNLIPKPSNSFVKIAKSTNGFKTSSTIKIKLHVRATAMTCRPRPFPSLAPSIIPGKSRIWIRAPLCVSVPGTVVSVVNSYDAASECVPLTVSSSNIREICSLRQSRHQCGFSHTGESDESDTRYTCSRHIET